MSDDPTLCGCGHHVTDHHASWVRADEPVGEVPLRCSRCDCGKRSSPAIATDPLVAALSAAAGGLPPVNGHAPLAVDVMRASRRKRDAEARLSVVLAAARAVDATHGHGGSVIDVAVALAGALRALRDALAAADGAL